MQSEQLTGKSWSDIHRDFAESAYGQSLSGKPRWDRYRPNHLTAEEWRGILGADAENIEHMKLTYGLMRQFLQRSLESGAGINEEDGSLLLLAALVHDWGKSSTAQNEGGDINWEHKTSDDTEKEQAAFSEVFENVIGAEYLKTQLIVENIVFEPQSRLGQMFNALERIGYMRTALRAHEVSEGCDDEVLAGHLRWLTAGVLSNQIVRLLDYAKVYPVINNYLAANEQRISTAFTVIEDGVFTEHGQVEKMRRDMYEHAKDAWSNRGDTSSKPGSNTESYNRGIFGASANVEARFIRNYEDVATMVEAMRTLGLKIVLTSGSFDLPHIGHARYISKAHEFGDVLVVGVDSDTKIQQRKGPDRPIVPEMERVQMLAHLRDVDLITLKYPGEQKWELIKRIRPDTLIATAETYSPEDIRELEANYCGRVIVLEPQATTSSSASVRRLEIAYRKQILEPVDRLLESNEVPEDVRRQIGAIILNARKNA